VQVLQLCSKNKAIQNGLFYDLMYLNFDRPNFNPDKQYAYMRYYENEWLLIVVNFDSVDVDTSIFIPAHVFDFFKIDDTKIGQVKDLLTNKKSNAQIRRNSPCYVNIKAHDAVVLKITIKK